MAAPTKNKAVEKVAKELQAELEKFKGMQKDYQKVMHSRQQLDAQLSENSLVKEELDRLEADARVYKMIGPVLVKQDTEEARQNVGKRIDYINGEIKRYEDQIKILEKDQEKHKEMLGKKQAELQQLQQAVGKS